MILSCDIYCSAEEPYHSVLRHLIDHESALIQRL
jgi:hypothetical protein